MEQFQLIAGVDEAGVGPLAGPVIAAAVILGPQQRIQGIADSKVLTEVQREEIFLKIEAKALAWAVGRADVSEIDEINILQATLLAMRRAILALSVTPEQILVDGKYCPKDLLCPAKAIIGGDASVRVISAASIVAKVIRDREMKLLDTHYPGYGFAQHKGYGTRNHLLALQKLGVSAIHRRSYAPVRACSKSY